MLAVYIVGNTAYVLLMASYGGLVNVEGIMAWILKSPLRTPPRVSILSDWFQIEPCSCVCPPSGGVIYGNEKDTHSDNSIGDAEFVSEVIIDS